MAYCQSTEPNFELRYGMTAIPLRCGMTSIFPFFKGLFKIVWHGVMNF